MRNVVAVFFFLLTLMLAVNSTAAEMFRGDPQHQGLYAGAGPRGDARIVWTVRTNGAVRSSPAVTEDTVYVGSEDGRLYAIARNSGRVLWRFAAGGAVNSSPAVDSRSVFVASADGFFNAVDRRSGKLRWRVETGRGATPRWGWEYFASSPVLAGGVVYAGGADGRLRALDAASGRAIWTTAAQGGKVISSPAVAGDLVIVGSDSGRLVAFDRTSGKTRWTFESAGVHIDSEKAGFDRRSIHASPAIDGDEVVVGSRDGFLYGIALRDGSERWRVDHHSYWVVASAAMWHGLALVGTSDGKNFEAVDRSGVVKWSAPTKDRIFSSAAVASDVAYAGCHDGSLLAWDAATGRLVWRFWVGAPITSSPVVRDGVLYVGADDGSVYAVAGDGAAAPFPHRVVYWRDDPPVWFRDGVRLRDYAARAGYEVVDAGKLADFLRGRIADREPSVVVFATNRIPAEVGADPAADSLLRRYLESGGRVAWYGLPPYAVVYDETTGKPKALDPSRSTAFLGVSFDAAAHDDLPVHPTAAGRARNLASWWIGSGGIPRDGIDEVLATDDYGRAVTWSRHVGSGEFLMIGGSAEITMDLADMIRLIETRPRPVSRGSK